MRDHGRGVIPTEVVGGQDVTIGLAELIRVSARDVVARVGAEDDVPVGQHRGRRGARVQDPAGARPIGGGVDAEGGTVAALPLEGRQIPGAGRRHVHRRGRNQDPAPIA